MLLIAWDGDGGFCGAGGGREEGLSPCGSVWEGVLDVVNCEPLCMGCVEWKHVAQVVREDDKKAGTPGWIWLAEEVVVALRHAIGRRGFPCRQGKKGPCVITDYQMKRLETFIMARMLLRYILGI